MKLPILYSAAKHALAEAVRIDEVKDMLDKAEQLEFLAIKAKDTEMINNAIELTKQAERRLGEIMAVEPKAKPGPKPKPKPKDRGQTCPDLITPSLDEQGIDKHLAKRARKAAAMTVEQHNESIKNAKKQVSVAVGVTQQTQRVQSWSGKTEWYTPKDYIDLAREVMGTIDLDPASSALAQRTVKAKQFFDEQKDGLNQQWSGNVFLNPPYNMPLIKFFVEKMVNSYNDGDIKAGILLTNNATDTEWAVLALDNANAICVTEGRIRFLEVINGASTEEKAAPTNGQIFWYFGKDSNKFHKVFGTPITASVCVLRKENR